MKASVITMDKEEAKEHYKEYLAATKVRKEKYVKELKDLYRHLSEGAKVIDIYEVFKNCEKGESGEPKIAIAPASYKEIELRKEDRGRARFTEPGNWNGMVADVSLPEGTFIWEVETEKTEWGEREDIVRKRVRTKVPVIPALLIPESKSLDGYYILFEVDEWNEVPATKDPYLLKRINANAFVVLAEWYVSEVELAVMRGVN
jgi:hypothetical protein